LICVPTYNEAENIERFVHAVFAHCPPEAAMLVIDDNSPDGTASIVENLFANYIERLYIMKRPEKQGGASAFLQAFAWGIERGYDAMLAMDADFSHDPAYIPVLLEKANGYDVVLGSRLVKGGEIEDRTFTRNIISAGASLYCRTLLAPSIMDWTGGYNLWSKNALAKIDLKSIATRGYSFQIEMKYKALRAKCKITEVPIVFPDRKYGTSKMSPSYFIKALLDVWRIKFMHLNLWLKQFIKFAITGGLGTITNLTIFFLSADILNLPVIPVSIVCFLIAGMQNYIINHKWSFSAVMHKSALSAKKYFLFLSSSLVGLAVNIAVMTSIIMSVNLPYKFIAQACGIMAGMLINFLFSKTLVFRRKRCSVN
jgi:dolichol-phosphate mannosyltransferase